ncbi:MAG: cold-shock protein [Actinobacteria bacterium]|nr:cold-shock protein [Actinomycetota bacterium]
MKNQERSTSYANRISRSDGEPDIFVHFSNIEGTGRRTLVAGQEVEFELGQGRKGTEANNVRAI